MESLKLVSDLDYDCCLIVSAEDAGIVSMEIDSIFQGNDVGFEIGKIRQLHKWLGEYLESKND